MEDRNSVYKLLETVSVKDVVGKKKVITVSVSNSIVYVTNILARYKVLACPVLQESDERQPIGWIDIMTIMKYVLKSLKKDDNSSISAESLKSFPLERVKVGDVLNEMESEPFITMYDSSFVHVLLELFAVGSHRTALYSLEKETHNEFVMHEVLSYVCSQSDVVKFINTKLNDPDLAPFANASLPRLGIHPRPVVSISENSSVIDAINMISEKKVTHLALVNNDGVVTGSFSDTALRSKTQDSFEEFFTPLKEYLSKHNANALEVNSVKEDAILSDVVANVTSKHLHHIWVLNDKGQATNIITLTDILNAMLKFRPSAEEKSPPPNPNELSCPGKLELTVKKAVSLYAGMLGVDPYVVIKLPGGTFLQSVIIPKSENPVFDFKCSLDVNNLNRDSRIVIELFDYRRFSPPRFLGVTTISVAWVLSGFGTNSKLNYFKANYGLQGGDPRQGEVELEFMYTEG